MLHLTEAKNENLNADDLLSPLKYRIVKVTKRSMYHYDLECVLDNDNESDNVIIVGPVAQLNYAKRVYWNNKWWKDTIASAVKLIDALSGLKKNIT